MKKVILLNLLLFFVSLSAFGQHKNYEFKKDIKVKFIGNTKHIYDLDLKKGEYVDLEIQQQQIDLQIKVYLLEKEIAHFDAPTGDEGPEVIKVPIKNNGKYTFEISTYIPTNLSESELKSYTKSINGSYTITQFEILSKKEYNKLLAIEKKNINNAISWIKEESITINTVKAEAGIEDLSYLKPYLKDVQVVGMGETSHGAKEIFQMKHRMLEFLVKELGFNVFAIEASHIGCRAVNDYVLHGKGNSRDALSEQGFWVWDTEEVIDMIEWMRTYNKTVEDNKKIQFIGIDTQLVGLDSGYQTVSTFFNKTVPSKEKEVNDLLLSLEDRKDILLKKDKIFNLLSYLILNKAKLVHLSSLEEFNACESDLTTIAQSILVYDRELQKNTDYNIRDENMAQKTLEILNKNPNTKIMLWAHNMHVSKNLTDSANGYPRPLGSALRQYLGNKYYAIGFSTNQGSFQAMDYDRKEKKINGVIPFKFGPSDEGSLDWYFTKANKDILFIDFRNTTNPIVQFFKKNYLKMHIAGATWSVNYSISPSIKTKAAKSFDGMIFIKKTSGATQTPNGKAEIERRKKIKR